MAKNNHTTEVSPHITGGAGLFSKPRKPKTSKNPPKTAEMLIDCEELITKVLRAYTNFVNEMFPSANFLSMQAASHIEPDTKLSFILRTRYDNLTKMKLPKKLTNNYRKTVRDFLNEIRNNTLAQETYTQLRNIAHVYQSLSAAREGIAEISMELQRLSELNITSRTVDRQLQSNWTEENILDPVKDLLSRLEKSLKNSTGVSSELKGHVNSLASFTRLVESTTKTSSKLQQDARSVEQQNFIAVTAPAS